MLSYILVVLVLFVAWLVYLSFSNKHQQPAPVIKDSPEAYNMYRIVNTNFCSVHAVERRFATGVGVNPTPSGSGCIVCRFIREDYEVCQVLGRALGYPEYPPNAKGADVITADHVPITLAKEAATTINRHNEVLRQIASSNSSYAKIARDACIGIQLDVNA